MHISTPSYLEGGVDVAQSCYGHTVCLSLIVWSSGRPGHLRLLPDNEYDEDG